MKKVLSLFMIVVLVFAFAACSKDETKDSEKKADEIKVSDIAEKIVNDVDVKSAKELEKELAEGYYNINDKDVEEISAYNGPGTVFPDDIVIVKAKDKDAAESVKASLEAYLSGIQDQSRNYGSESDKYALDCKVLVENETIVALFISADHAQMEEIFKDAVK